MARRRLAASLRSAVDNRLGSLGCSAVAVGTSAMDTGLVAQMDGAAGIVGVAFSPVRIAVGSYPCPSRGEFFDPSECLDRVSDLTHLHLPSDITLEIVPRPPSLSVRWYDGVLVAA